MNELWNLLAFLCTLRAEQWHLLFLATWHSCVLVSAAQGHFVKPERCGEPAKTWLQGQRPYTVWVLLWALALGVIASFFWLALIAWFDPTGTGKVMLMLAGMGISWAIYTTRNDIQDVWNSPVMSAQRMTG